VYPNAEFKYAMFNNIFIPYIGLRGGLKQTTLQGLTQVNPFIQTNVALRNEHNPYDIYGGFKGSLSKTLSFNVGVHFLHMLGIYPCCNLRQEGPTIYTISFMLSWMPT